MATKAKYLHGEIEGLIRQGLTNPEIAKELDLTISQVSCHVQRNLGGNPNYQKRIKKHNHLHERILKLRLKFSDEEIMEKLHLTKGEMKSCMTYAYRNKNLSHIRKDKRRRDSWSSGELKFLLRWSGIISQEEINNFLKRGKSRIVIKEKMQNLGLASKNVNGLTFGKFKAFFKSEPNYYLETSAGSPASVFSERANWKIVPWFHIDEMVKAKEIKASESFRIHIEIMTMFQKWVHGDDVWKSLTSTPRFR